MSRAVGTFHVAPQPGWKHKHTVRKVKTLSRLSFSCCHIFVCCCSFWVWFVSGYTCRCPILVSVCLFVINIAKLQDWTVLLEKKYVMGYCCYSVSLGSGHSHLCALICNNWSSTLNFSRDANKYSYQNVK